MAGGSLQLEGPAKEPAWTTLAEDAPIGATLLQLAQAANWQVGPHSCAAFCLPFQHLSGLAACASWWRRLV